MDYSMFLSSRAAPPPLPGFHTFLEGQDLIDANKLEATITTSPNGEVTVSHPSKNQTWHRGQRVGRGGQATIFFERSVPSPAAPSALVRVIKKQVTANGEATTTPDDIRNELAILLYFTHSSRPDLFTCAQGWFMEGPHHVIAMKLLQGDLEDHIRETKAPFSEPDTRIIARQVLDALAFMHARGFTHRDVKLNNIMVAAKPRPDAPFIRWSVRLGDFGLSQYHDDSTLPPEGRISGDGTANYKAPELFYIVDPDEPTLLRFEAKADMYALGVTIFRMLTGEAPYEVAVGDEDPQVVKKFSRDGPPEEPFDKACVSRKGRGFVRVLTMIDPSARPTAATALHMSDWLKGTE
ncbi:kinase-like domain-containing protein [Podospora conica]|nr:kinase-like domain-containing protein [Schizothecium conicum]